jgi:hypothetical protein
MLTTRRSAIQQAKAEPLPEHAHEKPLQLCCAQALLPWYSSLALGRPWISSPRPGLRPLHIPSLKQPRHCPPCS